MPCGDRKKAHQNTSHGTTVHKCVYQIIKKYILQRTIYIRIRRGGGAQESHRLEESPRPGKNKPSRGRKSEILRNDVDIPLGRQTGRQAASRGDDTHHPVQPAMQTKTTTGGWLGGGRGQERDISGMDRKRPPPNVRRRKPPFLSPPKRLNPRWTDKVCLGQGTKTKTEQTTPSHIYKIRS